MYLIQNRLVWLSINLFTWLSEDSSEAYTYTCSPERGRGGLYTWRPGKEGGPFCSRQSMKVTFISAPAPPHHHVTEHCDLLNRIPDISYIIYIFRYVIVYTPCRLISIIQLQYIRGWIIKNYFMIHEVFFSCHLLPMKSLCFCDLLAWSFDRNTGYQTVLIGIQVT